MNALSEVLAYILFGIILVGISLVVAFLFVLTFDMLSFVFSFFGSITFWEMFWLLLVLLVSISVVRLVNTRE